MNKTRLLFVAVLPGAFCNAFGDNLELSDSLILSLNDVEVVANRANEKTPIAYSNLKAEDIAAQNCGVDVPYLLMSTPSVITTSDAGAGVGYTYIRVRGSDASRINVTANGVPINDAESHRVYWVDLPDLASSIKDIQVQRGAGTSTNGAGAFGASINMVTSSPRTMPYAEFNGSYGSYNTNKQTLRVGSGMLSDHWTVDARLSHIGTDGYIDRAWSKLWSYFGQVAYYEGAMSLRFIAFGGKELTYQAWDYASKEEMEKYGRRYNPCGKYTDSAGNTAYYPNQIDNFVQHNFQLVYHHKLMNAIDVNVALHYTRGDGYYEQYKTRRTLLEYGLKPFEDANGNLVEKSDLVRYKYSNSNFGGGVFTLSYKSGPVETVLGGAMNKYRSWHFGQIAWIRNYVGPLDPLQQYYHNVGDKLDANIYARANVDIWRGLTGYIDLQYRHIDNKIKGASDNYDWNIMDMYPLDIHHNYNFFNPKGGFTYRFNDRQRAYASVSVAHKEPTRDNYVDAVPGHEPKAEKLVDWEAGYTYEGSWASAGVNFYYMDYYDQLVPTGQLSDTGNPVAANVDRSYRTGIELQWRLQPVKWFDWEFTTTLSRNRIKNFVEYIYEDEWHNPITFDLGDTPISFSPDLTLHNSLNFKFGGLDASLKTRYVSKQYLTNAGIDEASLDAYCVSDLYLGYTFRSIPSVNEMHLGFTVFNMFNEKYENNGYAGAGYYVDNGQKVIYRYAGYAAQAPTNVMATISIKF